MIKYQKGIAPFITLLLLATASTTFAADCLAIRKKIQQETDLLKRRELVKQGLTNCPNDPVINFKYAYSLERFRKYNEALKHYQVATKLDPKYAKAYFGMGDIYLQLDNPHDSVTAYQKGLSIDPDNKRAARSMQDALSKAKVQPAPSPRKVIAKTTKTQAKPQAKPKAIAFSQMKPYKPTVKTIFQTPQNQIPVAVSPLGIEPLQSFSFTKAGHSDATGSLDDNLMKNN